MVVTRSQVKLPQEPSEQAPAVLPSGDQPHGGEQPQVAGTSQLAHSSRSARTRSIRTHSNRSSTVIAARKAAAEAEHMRRVAQLEIAQMEAEAEAQAKIHARRVELERKAAEALYQAEVAAIEADSRQGSRSGRSHRSVEQWVDSAVASIKSPSDPNLGLPAKSGCEVGPSNQVLCSQDPLLQNVGPTFSSIAAHRPAQLPQHDFSRGNGTAATDTRGEDIIGVTQLVQALRTLTNNGSNNKNIIKLPVFDGKSSLDWLMFKRAFQDTVGLFTDAENLARLNQAIKGAAREAVSMLLVMAPHADDVIAALDRRFGRPEQIVIKEVNAIRALPKLGQEVSSLFPFATRVRNCVAVTKLLHHTDYLRSPELFGALLSKLTPLLRARWLDFAASHENGNQARVELLSDFLNREVDLVLKFGAVFDNLAPDSSSTAPQRQRAHAVSEHHTLLHSDNFIPSTHLVKEVSPDPTVSAANDNHILVASNNTRQVSSLSPLLKVLAVTISGPAGCEDCQEMVQCSM
uniref:Uncharacterized protein n=1 Tax=Heliothis virescens TaxID=7102 RepID=A0A2A4J8D5_HELVI